jgi:hypothetical protein
LKVFCMIANILFELNIKSAELNGKSVHLQLSLYAATRSK